MDAVIQPGGGNGGDDGWSSSSAQIFQLLISDFLSPLTSKNAKKNTDLVLQQKVLDSARILVKIVRNALRSHQSEKFRKVRMSNAKIQKMVVTVPYAVDLLTAVGFVYAEFDNEKYLVFTETDQTVASANLFCSLMEEELQAIQAPPVALVHSTVNKTANKKATTGSTQGGGTDEKSPNNGSGSFFLSDEERKARALKAKQAKLAKKAEKERAIKRWAEDQEERLNRQKKREAAKVHSPKSFDCADHIKIRKLSDDENSPKAPPPPPPSGDGASGGGESLESLRALAAKAWNLKQQKSSTSAAGNDDNGEDETNVAVAMAGIPVVEDDSSSMELPETADEDRKPAAVPTTAATRKVVPPALGPTMVPSETISPSNTWQERSKGIPRCGPATGIYDTSVFKGSHKATMSSSTRTCLKRLFSEFEDLQKSLPSDKLCSAWLRFDEERPQFIRAILTAPLPGPSPYAGGVFAFDIMIPNSYPNVSPKVQIITTGRGKIRFGPNLYASGKVCLSLLGTWSGPKWNPKKSSLFQVLVSIQSLLLGVEHPYFLEPGHGGWEEKVKEGDFASVGNTLSGKVVREDSRLPAHVWAYEDTIRVASLRYAILEPLTVVASQGKISDAPNSNLAHLLPFREVLHLHFSQNANDIAESVAEWINASRPTFIKSRNGRASMNPHHENLLNNMKNAMMPQNKSREEPKTPYPAKFVNDLKKWNGQVEGYLKTVCEMQPPAAISMDETGPNTIRVEAMKPPPSSASTKNDVSSAEETDLLRQKMKDAVESKNYILAGQIQTEIQELESFQQKVTDMEAKMSEAVSKKDYVTAGKLQAELKMLHNTKQKQNFPMQQPSIEEMHNSPMEQMMASLSQPWDDGFEDDDMSFGEDDDDDDDSFAPPPPHTNRRVKRKEWGTGHVLNEAVATPTSSTQVAAAPAKIAVSRLPLVDVRRLRIRLPNSSVLEEFDGAEKLSTVYQVVQQHLALAKVDIDRQPVQPKLFQSIGYTDDRGSQKVGALGGAFAAPLSEFGFTLLSTHPKREYSLEMDGMKSLDELNVAKSAALTVMKCNERGVAKRADLEDKLAAAKGDAMDVDDLNYEALQELGEKIGIVAPGDGTRKMLDESALERVSALLSPKEFLCRKTTGDNDDSRCCICLGDFDPNDSNPSLRLLNHCGHVMHSSCLQTWLTTTTSCPVCKHSLSV